MFEKLIRDVLSLMLLLGALSLPAALAAEAAPTPPATSASIQEPAARSHTPTPASTTPSPSPSGPVDPGTGETKAAKEARVDYAPYVITAVVIIVLLACLIFWRKRSISHPRKTG